MSLASVRRGQQSRSGSGAAGKPPHHPQQHHRPAAALGLSKRSIEESGFYSEGFEEEAEEEDVEESRRSVLSGVCLLVWLRAASVRPFRILPRDFLS